MGVVRSKGGAMWSQGARVWSGVREGLGWGQG